MMKIYYLFIFIVSSVTYSQNFVIDYKFSIIDNKDEYGVIGFSITRLITNRSESITFSRNIDTIITQKDKEPFIEEATEFNASQYKDFINGKRYSKTLFPKYNLKDESYSIVWSLEDSTKTILGYPCQKATGSYRGRDYVAYFTSKIPIQTGPHTFDNLPGLVLEVYSTDNVVHFKAIEIKETEEKIINPFVNQGREFISWEQFIIAYKEYFNKMTNYKPEEDTIYIVPNRSIEKYF
ncbi:GLPGLI family protein [Flavobacterium macrobrachii]|uniref:GLPGLI family protein n=1 Tax=Flavobacterium macrobrachii TaxID=591204 RepID=UPI0037C06611